MASASGTVRDDRAATVIVAVAVATGWPDWSSIVTVTATFRASAASLRTITVAMTSARRAVIDRTSA